MAPSVPPPAGNRINYGTLALGFSSPQHLPLRDIFEMPAFPDLYGPSDREESIAVTKGAAAGTRYGEAGPAWDQVSMLPWTGRSIAGKEIT
jgi:hypothetical protein